MRAILRAEGDWQDAIAMALSEAPRPIPPDNRLAPRARTGQANLPRWDRSTFPAARAAATLLLVHPDHDGELVIPLTIRHRDLPDHPGEISLPGGAVDPGDASLEDTALREAAEEVGLDRSMVRVVGMLDDIWIPVSNFELRPVVATSASAPTLTPREEEVEALILFPLRLLLAEDAIQVEEITVRGAVVRAGVYRHAGHRIWGATARTLSMLGTVLRPSLD